MNFTNARGRNADYKVTEIVRGTMTRELLVVCWLEKIQSLITNFRKKKETLMNLQI